ncbi:MAG: hypothetical protein ACLQGP_34595 [Isosphaeraceae bacterium]
MAKKAAKGKPMNAVKGRVRSGSTLVKGVRLDLSEGDHERLERCSRELGLTMASYARMAVLERLKADEAGGK